MSGQCECIADSSLCDLYNTGPDGVCNRITDPHTCNGLAGPGDEPMCAWKKDRNLGQVPTIRHQPHPGKFKGEPTS